MNEEMKGSDRNSFTVDALCHLPPSQVIDRSRAPQHGSLNLDYPKVGSIAGQIGGTERKIFALTSSALKVTSEADFDNLFSMRRSFLKGSAASLFKQHSHWQAWAKDRRPIAAAAHCRPFDSTLVQSLDFRLLDCLSCSSLRPAVTERRPF